jgi:hypothetical protein
MPTPMRPRAAALTARCGRATAGACRQTASDTTAAAVTAAGTAAVAALLATATGDGCRLLGRDVFCQCVEGGEVKGEDQVVSCIQGVDTGRGETHMIIRCCNGIASHMSLCSQ